MKVASTKPVLAFVASLALLTPCHSAATKLTTDTFFSETAGKTVFIKFVAPWSVQKLQCVNFTAVCFSLQNYTLLVS